jgi:hypothetical protein
MDRLAEQNARDKTSYTLPQIFDEQGHRLARIALALVAVDDEGVVQQGHIWEKTLEQTSYGISAKSTVCSMREQYAIFYILNSRGYEDFHLFVPKERVEDMQHGLETIYGLSATGLTHFYRRLDPAENAALQEFYKRQLEKEGVSQ